jgi:hypothetical protein
MTSGILWRIFGQTSDFSGGFLYIVYTIHFAVTNSEAVIGSSACFYEILWPARQKLKIITSLRERTAQNARSFKLSDHFERCANSFF